MQVQLVGMCLICYGTVCCHTACGPLTQCHVVHVYQCVVLANVFFLFSTRWPPNVYRKDNHVLAIMVRMEHSHLLCIAIHIVNTSSFRPGLKFLYTSHLIHVYTPFEVLNLVLLMLCLLSGEPSLPAGRTQV